MRLKRMLALCCTAVYILTAGAAAAEPAAASETVGESAVFAQAEAAAAADTAAQDAAPEAAAETTADTVSAVEPPVARAITERIVVSDHKVQVNGQAVKPQAYNIGGYNYFKLRDIAYMLRGTSSSFDVTWDSVNQAINIISGATYTAVGGEMTVASVSSIRVQESTAKLLLDGSGISIKGYNINGNNYYKIADMSAAIGFSVAFESTSRTVQITTPAQSPDPEPAPEPDPEDPEETFLSGV